MMPRMLRRKTHQERLDEILKHLSSGDRIDYSKYMASLVDLGSHLPNSALEPSFKPNNWEIILRNAEIFRKVWAASELNRVQVGTYKDLKEEVTIGTYNLSQKTCRFIEAKPNELLFEEDDLPTMKVGQSYKVKIGTIPETLQAGSSYYIRQGKHLYYINQKADFTHPKVLLVSKDASKLALEEDKDLNKNDFLRIAQETKHAHIKDESHLAAKFNLARSTQKQVDAALNHLDQYWQQQKSQEQKDAE